MGWDQAAFEGVRTCIRPHALLLGQSQDAGVVSCGHRAIGQGPVDISLEHVRRGGNLQLQRHQHLFAQHLVSVKLEYFFQIVGTLIQ